MALSLIYKICPAPLWREAERAGHLEGAPVDLADGFIHLSTAAQVAETAARHFGGRSDLVLVSVDVDALSPALLRFEPSRGGDLFPHLYGHLPLSAVTRVAPLPLGPDGRHVFPDLAPGTMPATEPFDPAAEGWTKTVDHGFIELVGPLWSRREPEGMAHGFLAEARHLNRGGIVHGGMLMTFADQALGFASIEAAPGGRRATIQLDTHFVAAVREGDFVVARCRVVRRTRSVMFMTGTLSVGESVVATANGIWKTGETARPTVQV